MIRWGLCSKENPQILHTLQFSSPSSILLPPLTLSTWKVFKLPCQSYRRCSLYFITECSQIPAPPFDCEHGAALPNQLKQDQQTTPRDQMWPSACFYTTWGRRMDFMFLSVGEQPRKNNVLTYEAHVKPKCQCLYIKVFWHTVVHVCSVSSVAAFLAQRQREQASLPAKPKIFTA